MKTLVPITTYNRMFFIIIFVLTFTASANAEQAIKPSQRKDQSADMMIRKRSSSGMAKSEEMAPAIFHDIKNLITSLKNKQKNNTLTNKELELLFLMQFAIEVGEVKTVRTYGHRSNSLAQVIDKIQNHTIIQSFEKEISKKSKRTISTSDALKIKQNRSRLEKIFGAKSFSWAWILNQIKEQVSSKKILRDLFLEEYKRAMGQQWVSFGSGFGPLEKADNILKILLPLCDTEEQKSLNEKFRKIKVHISNLPQSNIRT